MYTRLTVRQATSEDCRLLSVLGRTTFEAAFGPKNDLAQMAAYVDEAFDSQRIAEQLADSKTFFLLAEQHGKPMGYAKLRIASAPDSVDGPDPIELERIYSVTEAIGRGVGAALMASCLDVAGANFRKTLWLGVWEHNRRAIRFYEKWGFSTVGDQTFMLGNEAQRDLVMVRSV